MIPAQIRTLAVVGTGLIGASAGLAARRAGVERVVGWDADEANLALACERGALDAPAADLVEAVKGADLVLVAVPVASLPHIVVQVLAAGGDATVTDVGSTKSAVCAAAGTDPRFIGGHPISGAETRGPGRATAELFDGATWFLTPVGDPAHERFRLVHGFVSSLGARPVAISPGAHDRVVALTSHLPHVIANVLVEHAGASRIDGHDPIAAAGGSLRDMTRIAGANPRVWVDIFVDNRDALLASLAEHRRRIAEVEDALERRDTAFISDWIGNAAGNRRRMLDIAYEGAGELYRLRVHVADEPGVLAAILQALGAERINISDFELQHLSHERGGTLTLLVTGESEAGRAADLLERQGYGVIVAPVIEE